VHKISVVHVVADLHRRSGGPSRTVVQLTDSLAKHLDMDILVLSQCFVGDPGMQSDAGVDRREIESPSRHALSLGLPLRRALRTLAQVKPPALIHSHGMWSPVNHWAAVLARQRGIPLILQPRGMLEPWALSQKALKKRIAMALYQRQDIDGATLFVVTAAMEFESIRALGIRQPIAVIPNGVLFSTAISPSDGTGSPLREEPEHSVLFLSRVHPKKGVLDLLHAWAVVAPQGWRLKIAGPDEGGHLAAVMALARALNIDHAVDYLGDLDAAAKSRVYENADLFVLPTYSENFGVVVAEALSHALPVITTRGAPWADLETYECGWWIDIGVDPLVDALREAIALSDEGRQAMGRRGRAYVQRYDWADIAGQMIDVYKWILGQVAIPDCVRLD